MHLSSVLRPAASFHLLTTFAGRYYYKQKLNMFNSTIYEL